MRKAVSNVVELDTAMVELRKVTDETESAYASFYNQANKIAKVLGASTKDVISATADSEFAIHDFNANKKLTASTNYILNGVKTTNSLSTVFVRLILAENADGTGATTTIEKVAGDFNVTTTTNLYYKISIIIKSGVTLSASLYDSIPTLYPK